MLGSRRSGGGESFSRIRRDRGRSGNFESRTRHGGTRIFFSLGWSSRYEDEPREPADRGRNCESVAGKRTGQPALRESRRAGFTQNRQDDRAGAAYSRYRTSGNGCGRGTKSKGKAETASRDKNVSGAADSGESRRGGTRAVSFAYPCHFKSRRTVDRPQLSLVGRPRGEARIPAAFARGISHTHQKSDPARRSGNRKQSA